jgi:hypothetical protein
MNFIDIKLNNSRLFKCQIYQQLVKPRQNTERRLGIPGIGEVVGTAATIYSVCDTIDCKQLASEELQRDTEYVRNLHQGQVLFSSDKTRSGFLTPQPIGGVR